jgi:DNA-binding response OmpR family regulator
VEQRTILIGEDDEFLLQFIRVAFTMEGFRVEVARTGPAALALAQSGLDAVLLDVCLPGSSGREVLRALRDRAETRDLPVALMSGGCDSAAPLLDGAQAFVRKPFTMASVIETMKGLLP